MMQRRSLPTSMDYSSTRPSVEVGFRLRWLGRFGWRFGFVLFLYLRKVGFFCFRLGQKKWAGRKLLFAKRKELETFK